VPKNAATARSAGLLPSSCAGVRSSASTTCRRARVSSKTLLECLHAALQAHAWWDIMHYRSVLLKQIQQVHIALRFDWHVEYFWLVLIALTSPHSRCCKHMHKYRA